MKNYRKLPDAELEIMMILWRIGKPASRMEIEEELGKRRSIVPTTLLSFLARLEEKGFVKVDKQGKSNVYTPLISEQTYMQRESKSILEKMYHNSVKNFVTSLVDGDHVSEQDLEDLYDYLEEKRRG